MKTRIITLFVAAVTIGFIFFLKTLAGKNEWRTPIEFFGRVVDENSNPVVSAEIHFIWTDLSSQGSSAKQTTSNENGLFSLLDARGKVLTVQVTKDGYYAYKAFPVGFFYAGANQNFVPDAANPVVFRLKKKGTAEPLVQAEGKFSVPRNGTPVEIDLHTGKQVPTGQGHFRVECWTEEPKARGLNYNWKCRITVPGGGLLVSTNQFDFQAPQAGYAELEEIDMPILLNEQWARTAKRNYFLKLNNGRYARASFEMISFNNHFFKIGAFINPSGSRNLEFDPAVQPKQTQFE